MDIQFWIWLAIIVITLIARARRAKSKPQPREDAEPDRQEGRPVTFEELLKEIQSAKQPREVAERPVEPEPYHEKPVYRQPEPAYGEVDYDDNLGEEEQDLETIVDDRKSVDIYESAKQQAFSRPSLEETMKLEDTIVRFGQFKGYESKVEQDPLPGFLADLRDPQGIRRAFVLSEILKPKF
jgi:hypothetical protein